MTLSCEVKIHTKIPHPNTQTRGRATHKYTRYIFGAHSVGRRLLYLLLELFEPLFLGFQLLAALLQMGLARGHLAQGCLKLRLDVPNVLLNIGYLLHTNREENKRAQGVSS